MADNEFEGPRASSDSSSQDDRNRLGREPYRRSRARDDLRPSPHFHDGPSWSHVPGGRSRHEVSFRGSSRSYHDSGKGHLQRGNVRITLQSMGTDSTRLSFSHGAQSHPANPVLAFLSMIADAIAAFFGFLLSKKIPGTPVSAVFALVLAIVLLAFGIGSCSASQQAKEQEEAAAAAAQSTDANRVSFLAVGDNLPDKTIGEWADSKAGSTGDDSYDYSSAFEPIKQYVQAADLSYVDQESVIGGNEIGPVGYPTFNTTDEMADALESTGFDLVGAASNHTYDHGKSAVTHAASVLNSKSFTMVGINESKSKAASYKVVQKGNISFAFLDYTYGLNDGTDGVDDWLINVYGEDRLEADVSAAKKEADVVIVAMHWGTEKKTEPDSDEKKYAQILADAGADVVIGSHPHVIQPMKWLKGEGGNNTLVCYSLGNFFSNHDNSNALPQLEGMMTCDFVKDAGTNEVSIENVTFVPLVNHRVLNDDASKCEFGVYALKDYTSELAKKHSDFTDIDDPVAWLKQQVDEVMGSDFTIDY